MILAAGDFAVEHARNVADRHHNPLAQYRLGLGNV